MDVPMALPLLAIGNISAGMTLLSPCQYIIRAERGVKSELTS